MKNSITCLVLIVLFTSCRSNTIYEEPVDLIPKDSMMMLLKDLYLATAAKNIKNKRQQRKVSYITLIYNKYNIDSLRFNRSNLYYTSKIDVYEPMLNEITELLEKEQKKRLINQSLFIYEIISYLTSTSSTSNIKVAFGGITPPAPLSP